MPGLMGSRKLPDSRMASIMPGTAGDMPTDTQNVMSGGTSSVMNAGPMGTSVWNAYTASMMSSSDKNAPSWVTPVDRNRLAR